MSRWLCQLSYGPYVNHKACLYKWLENLPSSPISALGASFNASKYLMNASGLNFTPALNLIPIESFEATSNNFPLGVCQYPIPRILTR